MSWSRLCRIADSVRKRCTIASPSQMKDSGILGMNGRNLNYISRHNPRSLLPLVDDKLSTKRMAEKAGLGVPKLIGVIKYQSDIRRLKSIIEPLDQFVVKPANGSGGKGIMVITGRDNNHYVKASGERLLFNAISRDVSNILGGLYSLGGKTDVAVIESLIVTDQVFNDYSFKGLPDIRVIVFQGFPVMAMMRLATRESDGKANLHQGAVGVGLDIANGHSLQSVQHGLLIKAHPDTGQKLSTLKIHHWDEILNISAACYEMTKLGYLGVDLVMDKHHGPLILELNARPGLAIQIANGKGIEPRLKTVESLSNRDLSIKERVCFSQRHFRST